MNVPIRRVLLDVAPELTHQGAALLFPMPDGLRVAGIGVDRDNTQQPEDSLVMHRGKLRSVVREVRVGDVKGSHPGVNER